MSPTRTALRFALRVVFLMGLATTPPLCVSPAAGQDAPAPPAAGRPTVPVRMEHHYRMLARVRPMLFWMTRDNVGGARVTWREGADESSGLELLIGSDPERAPRRINRWGYIAEETRGSQSRVVGVMKESKEESVTEAEKSLSADASVRSQRFNIVQALVSGENARAQLTRLHAAGNPSYRDLARLLSATGTVRPETEQITGLPAGTKAGFLSALAALIRQPAQPVAYVHFRTIYDMTVRSSDRMPTITIEGRTFTNIVRASYEVRSRSTGETTRFKITYGTEGHLAGVPIHVVYQPRWWFEVQLFLDEAARF